MAHLVRLKTLTGHDRKLRPPDEALLSTTMLENLNNATCVPGYAMIIALCKPRGMCGLQRRYAFGTMASCEAYSIENKIQQNEK